MRPKACLAVLASTKLTEKIRCARAVHIINNNCAYNNETETLSMKGLALNALGESEKAHEFCKKGLMANMKTHVTWHVYGLLYRAEK